MEKCKCQDVVDFWSFFRSKTKPKLYSAPPITIITQIAQYCESPGFLFHWYAPLAVTWHIFNVRLSAPDDNSPLIASVLISYRSLQYKNSGRHFQDRTRSALKRGKKNPLASPMGKQRENYNHNNSKNSRQDVEWSPKLSLYSYIWIRSAP